MTKSENRRGNESSGEDRRGGPSKKKTCKNGHDLDKHGIQLYTMRNGKKVKNGRDCILCRRKRGREWHAANYDTLRIKRAARELQREMELLGLQQESENVERPEVQGTG